MRKLGWMVLVCVMGCASDDEYVVEVAQLWREAPPVRAPASAVAGEPVLVEVDTVGGGCFRGAASTEVDSDAERFVVTPFNERDVTGRACPQILERITHEASLTFATPGTHTFVVRAADPEMDVVDHPFTIDVR